MNNIKNIYSVWLWLITVSLLIPPLTYADEKAWLFQPRFITGVMYYQFEYAFESGGNNNQLQINDNIPMVGLGGTLVYDRCFADAYYSQNLLTGEDGGGSYQPDTESIIHEGKSEFDRKDYAVTLGCMVTHNLSFSAGYKLGKTDINTGSTQNLPYDRIDVRRLGDAEFQADGFFIGASYSHPFKQGQLSIKFAVAQLDAEYNQINTQEINNRAIGDGPKTSIDKWFLLGDTTGLTAGINWTGAINKHVLYRIAFDGYHYDFDTSSAYVIRDGKTDFIDILGGGEAAYEMKETMYTVKLQLIYQF